MRAVALDVHHDFCEVAIVAEGRLRSAGRVPARPEALELFAQSLDPRDWVALEVTGNASAIAGILERHVARVMVVSPTDTGVREARVKTDRVEDFRRRRAGGRGVFVIVGRPSGRLLVHHVTCPFMTDQPSSRRPCGGEDARAATSGLRAQRPRSRRTGRFRCRHPTDPV